jgi:hypothetical protein
LSNNKIEADIEYMIKIWSLPNLILGSPPFMYYQKALEKYDALPAENPKAPGFFESLI